MITDCGVIVILRIAEGICPTMICDRRIFRYVNLKNTNNYLVYIYISISKHGSTIYQSGIRKTYMYTQVTLALHQMLIDSAISFSASFLTCFAGTRHYIKSHPTHYLSQLFRPQIQAPVVSTKKLNVSSSRIYRNMSIFPQFY